MAYHNTEFIDMQLQASNQQGKIYPMDWLIKDCLGQTNIATRPTIWDDALWIQYLHLQLEVLDNRKRREKLLSYIIYTVSNQNSTKDNLPLIFFFLLGADNCNFQIISMQFSLFNITVSC